jgi:small subunit ribosomal protein S19
MARLVKKGPFVDDYLMKKVEVVKAEGNKKPIKTWSRRFMVLFAMVGFILNVYNGR